MCPSQLLTYPTAPFMPMESRPFDFAYDPSCNVSSGKEFYIQAMRASLRTGQTQICPIFHKMFSDEPARNQIVVRHVNVNVQYHPGNYKPDNYGRSKGPFISPADMYLYVKCPVIKITPDIIPPNQRANLDPVVTETKEKCSKNKSVQTIYRESSAQTLPWKPKHYIIPEDNPDPELLKIDFLRNNLPAGMHEIELIKRARIRRIWESFLPEGFDPESLEKRQNIITAIETDQWMFREQEIENIQNLRMQLLENMLQELYDTTAKKSNQKLKRIAKRLNAEKDAKLKKMNYAKCRELRRLERVHKGVNIRKELYKMYSPGSLGMKQPKMMHSAFDEPDDLQLLDEPDMDTSTMNHTTNIKNRIKRMGRHLCDRETKWTVPVLKQLYEELLNLNKNTKVKCNLRQRIVRIEIHHETLVVQAEPDKNAIQNQAALLLQAVIKGRATQSLIYEGRDRCRELIMELQNAYPLQDEHARRIHDKRIKVMYQQREHQMTNIKLDNIQEMLDKLQGTVVGTLFDFLNKEYRRLLDERKAHALALMHERDRRDKEAAEAGRRQVEERRRKEHDEIFKQIVKVHQDTVDLYLQDIITEGVDEVANTTAKEYVQDIAKKLDTDPEKTRELKFMEREQLIADMVHHFMIPEVERVMDRQKVKKHQARHLKNAYALIFDTVDVLKKKPEDNFSMEVASEVSESCLCDVLETCDPRLLYEDPKLNVHL